MASEDLEEKERLEQVLALNAVASTNYSSSSFKLSAH